MKRLICAAIFVFAGSAVFARDFSFSTGAGGFLGGLFTRYKISADGNIGKVDASQKADQFNYGMFAYFDATYGVFSVSFQNGSNTYDEEGMTGKGWESMLGFSLIAKYPFRPSERLFLYPMVGIEYQISMVQLRTDPNDGTVYRRNDDETFRVFDWNSIFINLGGGLDFSLPKNFYLRGELIYSIRLMTPYESKYLDTIKSDTGDSSPDLGGLCSGPSFRLSLGWRFYKNY